jgi:hypothetical protein
MTTEKQYSKQEMVEGGIALSRGTEDGSDVELFRIDELRSFSTAEQFLEEWGDKEVSVPFLVVEAGSDSSPKLSYKFIASDQSKDPCYTHWRLFTQTGQEADDLQFDALPTLGSATSCDDSGCSNLGEVWQAYGIGVAPTSTGTFLVVEDEGTGDGVKRTLVMIDSRAAWPNWIVQLCKRVYPPPPRWCRGINIEPNPPSESGFFRPR